MESQVYTYPVYGREHQRIHALRLDSWSSLHHIAPQPSGDAFQAFCHVYQHALIDLHPYIFGQNLLFRLPPQLELPALPKQYPPLADPLTAAAAILKEGVTLCGGKPHFRTAQARELYCQLEAAGCVKLLFGKLPHTAVIPIRDDIGYLSKTHPEAAAKINSTFFIMDPFDCATVFDHVGTPLGLLVKDGVVLNPPLYRREALLVDTEGRVRIEPVSLEQLQLQIGEQCLAVGKNARLYTRPGHRKAPRGGCQLVIVGQRVMAVYPKGGAPIPASGFVLQVASPSTIRPGAQVTYLGLEDISFGLQVGNSLLRAGIPTDRFLSPFYNLRKLQPVPYPPSLFPVDLDKSRAARTALGADEEGRPILLWAEGAAKAGHVPGEDSCGATLQELSRYCADAGMVNAVSMDGGGSAQLLWNARRLLHISDRDPQTLADAERPVPMALAAYP